MKLRTWIIMFTMIWCFAILLAAWLAPSVEAQEVTVGTIGDEPVNLITVTEGSESLTVGVIGDEPVNIIGNGELILRIHWNREEISNIQEAATPKDDGSRAVQQSDEVPD